MARRSVESPELKTKEEVLEALGGDHGAAALTGSDYKNVETWKRARTFPSRYFLVMTFALHQRGYTAPPELWGQVTPAQRKQALTALIASARKKNAA
jgi:hypothetical protein